MQQTRPVFRVKRERSERGRVRHRARDGRTAEEGGEGWLEEGVGTSLTVQPTSYALGPTFRRLLSLSLSLLIALLTFFFSAVSFQPENSVFSWNFCSRPAKISSPCDRDRRDPKSLESETSLSPARSNRTLRRIVALVK